MGVRFALERLVLRGLGYRLLLAAAVVAAVALAAGALVALLDSRFSNAGEAVWWAFLRLTDPGYLGDDQGVARRAVSTIVTVLGYVLFLGLLVAILTQWMNEKISKLESAMAPVSLSDHVLILGWTHRTPSIVKELLLTGGRVRRFLARQGTRALRVVILADYVDAERVRELRDQLGALWNDRQVLLRAGSPLRLDHLERVSFRDAAVLILPGGDFAEGHPAAVDAETIKTLMSGSRNASAAGGVPPLAVSELHDGRRQDVARGAYQGDSEIITPDEIIGGLMLKSVRQPGLCGVLLEQVTLRRGNSLYVRAVDGAAGRTFHELRSAVSRAILLGLMRPGDPRPALNPDAGTVVKEGDLLVFLAQEFEDCVPDATTRVVLPLPSPDSPSTPTAIQRRRVLVLGWNRKVVALLTASQHYPAEAFEIDVVSRTPIEVRERLLAAQGFDVRRGGVRQLEADFSIPAELGGLEPQRYDNVILVARERLEAKERADATTIFTHLMLKGLLPEQSGPRVFAELLEEENRFLLPNHDDVIVTPKLESYLLSQVALRRELAAVYSELFRAEGAQVVLQPAGDYGLPETVRFTDLEAAAARRGEIVLGLRQPGTDEVALHLNPDRQTEWRPGPDDQLVVLTSSV